MSSTKSYFIVPCSLVHTLANIDLPLAKGLFGCVFLVIIINLISAFIMLHVYLYLMID